MEVTANGARLSVGTAGEPRQPALLLIHGFPLDSAMWAAQLVGLAEECFVIVPDLRGHGRSDAPPGPYSMEGHARDLAALLDALDVRTAVVAGLSMGGYVALAFWRLFRERVSGLALIDSRAGADTAEGKAGRDAAAARIRERGMVALVEEMLPKLLAPQNAGNGPLVAELREMILRQPVEGMVAALAALRDRADSVPLLSEIAVPTSVIVGEADAITPLAMAQEVAARLSDVELVVVEGAGHMAPVEAPEEVNLALLDLVRRSTAAWPGPTAG